MVKLTDIFAAIFIINLVDRLDRKAEIKAELKKVTLSENDDKITIYSATRPNDKDKFPNVGAKGCFFSHLEILKQAEAQKLSSILIMEDDLAMTDTLNQRLSQIQQRLTEQPWSILYLGHIEKLPLYTKNNHQLDLITLDKDATIRTTHFYAINGNVIPRLIEFLETLLQRSPGHPDGGPMYYDGALSTFRAQNPDIITLLANPNLGWQKSSRSDIAQNVWFDNTPILKSIVAYLRKIKNRLKF